MLEEFKRIGKFLFQEGLVGSHGGDMSVRQGDKILITRRDAMLGDLSEGDVLEVGIEEKNENEAKVSRELVVHRAIYRQTSIRAIIHAHPASAIAVSITDNKIMPQDAEGTYSYKAAPIVRVRDAIGSEEAARILPSFFVNRNVIVMLKSHGSFAVGGSLEEAYKYTSSLENSCKVILAVRASGNRPSFNEGFKEKKERPRSAIPPGIGVMGQRRYNK
jgi:L-fuculose-phosphate aldolase